MDILLQGIDGINWSQALCNEWDRLAEGWLYTVKCTNIIKFIHPSEVPNDYKVIYSSFICDHKPLKPEPQRVQLTVWGDKLDYPFDTSSPASSLIDAKIMLNSTISDARKWARFMATCFKDFFLNTPTEQAKYMDIQYKYFPEEIRRVYNLDNIVIKDGWVYICIIKGMHGLKQAA